MSLNNSLKTGFSFGITSGVITTLGLLIGLGESTHSKTIVIGGILTIAVADALSDSVGIFISEESDRHYRSIEMWQSALATFLSKCLLSLSFIIPVFFLEINLAIKASIIYGLIVILFLSNYIAKIRQASRWQFILSHLIIALIVITATHFIGQAIDAKLLN